MNAAKPKRFYDTAEAVEAAGGHGIALDGKPVRTPAGRPLAVPGAALANAVAEEWAAQGETIDRETMPLTRLVCTSLDLVPERRAEIVAEIAAYAETDLVCYRTEVPPALAQRQAAAWEPLIAWAAERHGAQLAVTRSITPIAQAPEALQALRDAVAGEDDFVLAGLSTATRAFGSLVIALAMREGRLDAHAAADASLVDERYQLERWGEDAELAARCGRVVRDAADAERLFRLLAA
ncbi:MAG: ATPase [Rhodospirillales bacterium]|nr:ATPase [Rhodospirillales bacterium]